MDIPRRTKAAPDVPLESQQPSVPAGALASQQPLLQRFLELVCVAGVLREGGWPPPPRPVGAVTTGWAPRRLPRNS